MWWSCWITDRIFNLIWSWKLYSIDFGSWHMWTISQSHDHVVFLAQVKTQGSLLSVRWEKWGRWKNKQALLQGCKYFWVDASVKGSEVAVFCIVHCCMLCFFFIHSAWGHFYCLVLLLTGLSALPPHFTWLVDDLHLEICFSMLEALATTSWASVIGIKGPMVWADRRDRAPGREVKRWGDWCRRLRGNGGEKKQKCVPGCFNIFSATWDCKNDRLFNLDFCIFGTISTVFI